MPELSPAVGNAEATRDPIWEAPRADVIATRRRTGGIVALVLRMGVVIYLMFLIVDGALPQLEILLTRGHTPIPLTVYLLLPLALSVIFVRKRVRHNPLFFATLALSCYILIDWIVLSLITRFSLNELRLSLEVYLFAVIILGVCLSAPIAIRSNYVLAILTVLFCASFCVSALQFITKDAVVATQSLDNTFSIPSYKFSGEIRAFSLFSSGLHAGVFYCLTAGFGVSMCYTRGRKMIGLLVLAMSGFGCYATLTRLTMIGLVATAVAVMLLHAKKTRALVPYIPLLWVLLAVIVVGKAYYDSGQASGIGIGSTSSIEARLMEWRMYSGWYVSGSPAQMLFGQGVSQWMDITAPHRQPTSAPISIDNAYLDLLLNCGLLGLSLVVYFCVRLWRTLYRLALSTGSNLVIASTAVFSVLPFFSSINGFLPEIFMIGLLPLLCDIGSTEAVETPVRTKANVFTPEIINAW